MIRHSSYTRELKRADGSTIKVSIMWTQDDLKNDGEWTPDYVKAFDPVTFQDIEATPEELEKVKKMTRP
jgi:hypothetical protein